MRKKIGGQSERAAGKYLQFMKMKTPLDVSPRRNAAGRGLDT
jgi:hypothetical protein